MSVRSIDRIAATGTRGIVAFLLRTLAVWGDRRRQRLDLADLDHLKLLAAEVAPALQS